MSTIYGSVLQQLALTVQPHPSTSELCYKTFLLHVKGGVTITMTGMQSKKGCG